MNRQFAPLRLGWLVLAIASWVPGQTPAPSTNEPSAPGLRSLTGEDERRAKQLDEQIDKAMKEGRWEEAIAQGEELVSLRTRIQGARHFDTVDATWRVKTMRRVAALPEASRNAFLSTNDWIKQADSLYEKGKYTEAQPLFEKALEIRRRLLGDDYPDTATNYSSLASNLDQLGKYEEARTLHEKALVIHRRLLGDDHPEIATCYNNLAYILHARGRYGAAQPLYEKALAIRRRLLSDNHSYTAHSYDNLAYNLHAQGQYSAAQPLFEKALAIRRRLLGDDHPLTASTYGKFALNLKEQGKYAAAQPLFEKALAIRRRLLSDEHPLTATSYNGLAYNLHAQGKYAQAQPLFEKALAIRRRFLSDDHPHTATTYSNLASDLQAQGKYTAAQPLYEKALAIHRRLLGDDHPDTAISYNNLATDLQAQEKYSAAQPLFEKALAIHRQVLGDDHPLTATYYNNVALNLKAEGKYDAAQPLFEKALAIRHRLLTDDHPLTAATYSNVALNLAAQGKYGEAVARWMRAARGLETARLYVAFTGLERATATTRPTPLLPLAAVLARLGQFAEAWQRLEEDLGRGLLDELAARQDHRLAPAERARLRDLITALERLDRLVESTPQDLDKSERVKRFEDLRRQRELASIALGEFQAKLVQEHGTLAGPVATLNEIQSGLPADAALVAWIDIPPRGPNAADPNGEHWGALVRSQGAPVWVRLQGTGTNHQWTEDDTKLTSQVRDALSQRPGPGAADAHALIQRLRAQRLAPLTAPLRATAVGLPAARRLIVLPSAALAGVPVEALLQSTDPWTVSYAPSATVLTYLRHQPRGESKGGLLALGDPVFPPAESAADPGPLPDHGLLVTVVVPGGNAAQHGLKPGDVLLAYNGTALNKREDLKAVPESGQPVPVEVWRDGRIDRRELGAGKLGVVLDPRPAALAIQDQRRLDQVLIAARSGSEHFARLPGTRYEVEALAQLFETAHRPVRVLTDGQASEPELDRMAASGGLGRFAFLHLATHGLIDETIPQRSAVILTQTGLPDPLTQVLNHKPAYDGRLAMREIQQTWELHAELVTLSACESARGQYAGGEGFVGFTQALLMSGARRVCLSLWKVDDTATALLMQRFYADLLGARPGLSQPMPKAEALAEAKAWLRGLRRDEVAVLAAKLSGGEARAAGATKRKAAVPALVVPSGPGDDRPYAHAYYWAAFVLVGDPD
jgi:tetratricopeptide (TPR) repeat protein